MQAIFLKREQDSFKKNSTENEVLSVSEVFLFEITQKWFRQTLRKSPLQRMEFDNTLSNSLAKIFNWLHE